MAKPTVSFEVGPGEGVNIAATLCWQIVGFGPTLRCENTPVEPEGSATLSSTVHIQLRVNQHGVEQHRFSLRPTRLLIRETWRCAVPEPLPEMSEQSESVTPLIAMMGVFD
ncbi:hypothetical protein SGGMMB4_02514 [Sodalis glossinidius str. 'morsitans']|uniref:Uncharacterized protein n=1 Tax=Sodalis glossinidius (strain morsitans) TaxID=343509 RepID=A0A193QJD3_SODGM|nr:hypothetical protein SGGMMB4_02514 [Sodalis glossinidius str. 'morsitans']